MIAASTRGRISAKCAIIAAAALLAVGSAEARSWYVAKGGTDVDNELGDAEHPFATIANGLAHANTDDSVIVGDGTYDLTETLYVTNAITLKSVNGKDKTTLKREGDFTLKTDGLMRRVIYIGNRDAVVDGFAITGGYIFWNFNTTFSEKVVGAGVLIGANGGTLQNCAVTNNAISRYIVYGAGIGALSADAVITNCYIADNVYGADAYTINGLGVYMRNGAKLLDSVIERNAASKGGLGLNSLDGSGVNSAGGTISGCRIANNHSKHNGGGMYVGGGGATVITNTTFVGNWLDSYEGVVSPFFKGGGLYANATVSVTDCTFEENIANGQGGGVYNNGSGSVFTRCRFVRNRAYNSTGANDPDWYDAQNATFIDCTRWDPTADPAGPAELTVVHPDALEKPDGAYTDLHAAVAAAGRGTTIKVGPGDYLLSRQLVLDKGVKLVSTDGAAKTILRRNVAFKNNAWQTNRVVRLSHPEARVEGFTITGGWCYYYGGVNCEWSGGGVLIDELGGALVSCVVTANGAAHYNGRGMGAAVFGRNSYISNCVFSANVDGGYTYDPMVGYGVYAACGARVTHSTFLSHAHSSNGRGTVSLMSGASLSHSTVSGGKMRYGGGIYIVDGDCRVDNCLVNGCESVNEGGGIYAHGGEIVNCTIADNLKASKGGGLYAGSSTRIANTIFSGNGATDTATSQWGGGAEAIYSNCFANVDFTASSHGCLKGDDPGFAAGGYALSEDSPCVNAGLDDVLGHAVATDLAGRSRYFGQIDIGAYEYHSDLLIVRGEPLEYSADDVSPAYGTWDGYNAGSQYAFSAKSVVTNEVATTAFACAGYRVTTNDLVYVEGGANAFAYTHPDVTCPVTVTWFWDFRYKATVKENAACAIAQSSADGWYAKDAAATFTATPDEGLSVYCWRVDGVTAGERGSSTLTVKMDAPHTVSVVVGRSWYVTKDGTDKDNESGDAEHPFATIANGLRHASTGETVVVGDGTYDLDETLYVTNAVALKSANGKDKTILKRSNNFASTADQVKRVVYIGDKDAVVDGFAITGGYIYWDNKGTFCEDVVGAGVLIGANGGTLQNCVVTNNAIGRHVVYGGGVGAISADALILNCDISDNRIGPKIYWLRGIGVYLGSGACLVDSTVARNGSSSNSYEANDILGGGIYSSGGFVSGCRIEDNHGHHKGGGLYADGETVVLDTTFARNWMSAYEGVYGPYFKGGGLYANKAVYVTNCTFEANVASGQGGGIYNDHANSVFSGCRFVKNLAYNSSAATEPGYYDAKGAAFVGCTSWSPEEDPAGPAEILVVHPDSADQPAGAYTDLHAAVAAAGRGTTIKVGPGNYLLPRQLVLDKGVKLVSTDGAGKTILRRNVTRDKTWQTNRVVRLSHPEARVEGFAITGGWCYYYGGCNCEYAGGGVLIDETGGSLVSCVVTNNGAAQFQGRGMGAAAFGRNSLVSNCVFAANVDNGWTYDPAMMGYGVYAASGAKITHSVFRDHACYSGGRGTVSLMTGASLSHSILQNNSMMQGGGVYVASSDCTVDNCLVTGCAATGIGGGIYAAGGEIVNCTIADNIKASKGGGIYAENGTRIVNTLFDGNLATDTATSQWGGGGEVIYLNCFANVDFTASSHGCVKGDSALFASGGYALSSASPCIDKGLDDALGHSVETDLAGTNRYSKAIDIGAYEYQYETFSGEISITTPLRVTDSSYTFACSPKFAEEAGALTYRWSVDGGAYGAETSDSTFTTSFATPGNHTVRCQVASDGVWQSKTIEFTTKVAPKTLYVVNPATHPEQTPVSPYDDPETAATNVIDAIAAADYGSTIRIGEGVYPMDETITLENAITLLGTEGAAKTEFRRAATWPNEGVEERCLILNHASARADGLTFSGGSYYRGDDTHDDVGGAGVFINTFGGTLANCVVTNCWAARHIIRGAGVLIQSSAGVVTNCTIAFNHGDGNGVYSQYGGGVYVGSGGLLTHSVISNNVVNGQNYSRGGGVYAAKGTVACCRIVNNEQKNAANGGGGLWVGGADVRVVNTLVANNVGNGPGAGIYAESAATFVNCTIADNTTGGAGGGLYVQNGATVLENLLFSGNKSGTAGAWDGSANAVFRNCFADADFTASSVDCVKGDDPGFAAGTYQLDGTSVCIDKGLDAALLDTETTDLAGLPRFSKTVDIGAYEYQYAAFSASVAIVGDARTTAREMTFSCSVKRLDETPATLRYRWSVDDGAYGEESADATFATTFAAAGAHTVRCQVSVDGVWQEPAEKSFTLAPKTLYVVNAALHPGHVPVAPYADGDTAATNVIDAVAVAANGSTILVDEGVYALTATVNLTDGIAIVGVKGAKKTELRRDGKWPGNGVDERCVLINHPQARVKDLTISGGSVYNWYDLSYSFGGAGVLIDLAGGTLESCVVTNCWMSRYIVRGAGVLIASAAGVVTNCTIAYNHAAGDYAYTAYAGGVYVSKGGTLTHSTVRGNVVDVECESRGAGVVVEKGTVRNCRITGNEVVRCGTGDTRGGGGGLYVSGADALVESTLVDNNSDVNYAADGVGGIKAVKGTFVNCTIVDNRGKVTGGVKASEGTFRNCIISGNALDDETASDWSGSAMVTYSLSPSALPAGEGNLTGAPTFTRRNYRLSPVSLGVNAGLYEDWMATATDLRGQPRATANEKVDMGAYQANRTGMQLIVR